MNNNGATPAGTDPPTIHATAATRKPPSWRRLHAGVIAANVCAAVIGALSFPVATVAEMGLGMMYGAANHQMRDADALLMLSVTTLYGLSWVCAVSIGISLHFGRRGEHRRALIVLCIPAAYLLLVAIAASAAVLMGARYPRI